YVRHVRQHPHPLLRLDLLRVPTYRAGVLGGSLFRIGIGATPFLLPLMLQLSSAKAKFAGRYLVLACGKPAMLTRPALQQ
ncbi:MAG: MFS transporter, partial [Myxococcaceae bacterium]